MEEDDRFAVVSRDPRFKSIPKVERKVKIDRRFEAMFKDKKFKLKYSVDKRGRPMHQNSTENLKRFYEMSDSDENEDDGEGEGKNSSQKDSKAESLELEESKHIEEEDHHKKSRKILTEHSSTFSDKKRKKKRLSGREELRLFSKKMKTAKKGRVEDEAKTGHSKGKNNMKELDKRKGVSNMDSYEDDDHVDKEENKFGEAEYKKNTRMTVHGTEVEGSQSGSCSDPSSSEDESEEDVSYSGKTDFSRGESFMESSSSDSEDTSDSDGNEAVDMEHEWGELDVNAVRSEDITSRLALCNMDWDRMTAQDLLMLLNSFKTSGTVIKSVKIYVSDFGLERLKEEEQNGPKELVEEDSKFKQLDERAEKKYFREKLRKYQLQRFKYYYAVVECDSCKTANSIYEQCDGYEFESSAVKLDLRFIPDDVTFDREPKDVAKSEDVDMETYKPLEFVSTALQQSRVDMTWDEDDQRRVRNINEAFERDNLESMDLNAYLASSSGEENNDQGNEYSEDEYDFPQISEEERLAKYRALVRDLDQEKQLKEDADMEMEVTWEPGLKDTTEELVSKKLEVTTDDSPWQQFLKKKKEKKREKKAEANKEKEKKKKSTINSDNEEEELAFSDDDLPSDVNLQDSFFQQETTDKKDKKKKSKKMRDKEMEPTEEDLEKERKKAELELLMMDEEDHKQHFNLKDIMKQEKSKKKKRRQAKEEVKVADNFEIDVEDSRFDAIYSSHHFAIDPSDPQFKRTKAMTAILEEKQVRRVKGDAATLSQRKTKRKEEKKDTLDSSDPMSKTEVSALVGASMSKTEVSALVKSIKRNTSNMKTKATEKHNK